MKSAFGSELHWLYNGGLTEFFISSLNPTEIAHMRCLLSVG